MVALAFSIVYAYTFNLIAIAVFTADAVYTDAAQFRLKLFDDSFFQSCAIFNCMVKHCSKFITSHQTVTAKVAVRIAFEDTIASQLSDVFICPVVSRNIREELGLAFIQHTECFFHLSHLSAHFCQLTAQVDNLTRQSGAAVAYMVGAVQSKGDACVNHVFTVAYGTANTEHYLFVRTIVSADCCSVFACIVAIACGEGQFVIRIEVHRMQCCQSCCACANLVHTAAQLVNAVAVADDLVFNAIDAVVDISFCLMQLTAVDSIFRIFFHLTICYVGNFFVISIQAVSTDIGLAVNLYAFIADGGLACGYSSCGYAYVFTNLHAVIVHYSLTGGYGSCFYSINVYVFLQLYLIVCCFTFFSSVVNSNIFAAFYFSVLSCSCCYVGKFLIQFADCGSSAIAIYNITFFYLAVLQIANLGVQLVVQVVYSFNNGSLTFAAVFKIVGNIINIAYITCFCYVVDYYLLVKLLAIFIKNV